MTDNLLKDKNDFNLSIPQYFVNTDPGQFHYSFKNMMAYLAWGANLDVGLSGEINQAALDEGINTYKEILWWGSMRVSLWKVVNSYGYLQNTDTYFNFLPITNKVNSTLQPGTVIDVPLFFLGNNTDAPTVTTINGGTVEIKGQIILNQDHPPQIEINIQNAGIYRVDRAMIQYGTFNINNGTFDFKGDGVDTNASVILNDKYGHPQTYKVTPDEVTYNNGNKSGLTYNEDKVYNSTINVTGGSIKVGEKGVIFLDHHNNLQLSQGNSTIDGNIVIGWDQNNFNAGGTFTINPKANILYSGFVDFGHNGFTGDGTFSLFGQYWDGKEFKLSKASIEGGTLGNLHVGYDSLYDNGLGGLSTTSDADAPVNKNVLYGGSLTISGNTTLEGTVSAEGGTSDYASTITLMNGTNITLKDSSKGFLINSNYSYFIAQDLVNFNTLDLENGTAKLGNNDTFTTLKAGGGNLIASSGTVTGTDLTENGGNLSFDTLVINNALNISGGNLKVNNLQDTLHTLNETGSGSIDLEGGNVNGLSLNSTANNTLNNIVVNSLTLESGDSGTTTINGGTYNLVNENGGILDFAGNATIQTMFNLKGKAQTFVEDNLTYNGNSITFSNTSTLTLNGGAIDFTGGRVAVIGQGMIINDKGGTVQLDNSTDLSFVNGLEIDGALNLTGSGEVDLYNTTNGNGSVNVNSGITLNLQGSSSINPTINLNDGSTLEIQDFRTITTSDINFVNKTGDQTTIIQFDNEFSDLNTTINAKVNNVGTSDRIDFRGINFSKETFESATYRNGKLQILYKDNGTTTVHQILLNNITGKDFSDGETFTIIDDGQGGSEIDFSTGHTSLNHNPLHSMFNAGNDNYVLNNGMSNDNLTNTPNHHTALMKDFSSTLNHVKGMFEPKSLNVTQNQFDQPTTLLGSDMLFKGQMNTHRELLSHVGKLCA